MVNNRLILEINCRTVTEGKIEIMNGNNQHFLMKMIAGGVYAKAYDRKLLTSEPAQYF